MYSLLAVYFVFSLPPVQERQSILNTAVDQWAIGHPDQVGEWLLRYQQHPDFDQVVAAVASSQHVVGRDPLLAISWADTIIDYDVRLQTLARIMDRWITRDDETAKNFLLTSPELTPETRADLRRRLQLGD